LLCGCGTLEDRVTDLEFRIIGLENTVFELQNVVQDMIPEGCDLILEDED